MSAAVAFPDQFRLFPNLIDFIGRDRVERCVEQQQNENRNVNEDQLLRLLHPARAVADQWPVGCGHKLIGLEDINQSHEENWNSEGIETIAQKSPSLASLPTNAASVQNILFISSVHIRKEN